MLQPSAIELAESLEQNRWIENGFKINVETTKFETVSIDTPEDLNKIKGIQIYGSNKSKNRLPIFTFNILRLHPHYVSEILNRNQICVRAGHHCTHVLHQALGISGTLRASLSVYNSTKDIDELAKGIEEAKNIFKV